MDLHVRLSLSPQIEMLLFISATKTNVKSCTMKAKVTFFLAAPYQI